MRISYKITLVLLIFSTLSFGQKKSKTSTSESTDPLKDVSLSGLKFRSIGPAITGGRIVDIAVNPENHSEYFAASGSGSLWKTTNNGVTWSPVFDGQSSFAMGCVTYDPSNPNTVWVGTGEANMQSRTIYGDGVYKSVDGGSSWENMGLKDSYQIGDIVVDPNNSDIVFVAAYGSRYIEGGDRGVYRTKDGGKTWERVLYINEFTGAFEVHMDPSNSNILYASVHQLYSHGTVSVTGGPESGIYRSIDGGDNWEKMMKGITPKITGRIGLGVSPANPNIVYAMVEAKEDGGFFRSDNKGESWAKQSSHNTTYPFYMQKMVLDPKDENKIFSMSLLVEVSTDGGKSFSKLGEKYKHVDNHAMWVDPNNTDHLISGNDGGIYETWDNGKNWDFKSNIPITEIYKVSTDNAQPFYNVYIGTQDNSSLVGPSRTINSSGITNREWSYTTGGDGFESQADWKDENIVYAQSQNGALYRFDKRSGERLFIQPVDKYDSGYRFDWDSPLLISKHDNRHLYFAANKVFKTEDQGSTWKEFSPDLTRGIPQKMDRAMGKSWSIDDMAGKKTATSIASLAESPLDANIVYAGTTDGVIAVTQNGGANWYKNTSISGVDRNARVQYVSASHHNKSVAYAAVHRFFNGDLKPMLYKTSDGGRSWVSISANLPERGNTYCIVEDHKDPNLLFAGTQFGLYVSVNGGKYWSKFMTGMPASATVKDIEIQKKEDDLVVATHGRGVYILDDYSPLRNIDKSTFDKKAILFPIKDSKMFVEANPFGFSGKGFQGASFYMADNPPVGATFTYFIKSKAKSLKDTRRDLEKERQEKNLDLDYPQYDQLRKESEDEDPFILFEITNSDNEVVRRIKKSATEGVNRVTWDFRYPPVAPVTFKPFDDTYAWSEPDLGYYATPGTYKVSLTQFAQGEFEQLVPPTEFKCVWLNHATLPAKDLNELEDFNEKVAKLARGLNGADEYLGELKNKVKYFKKALTESSGAPIDLAQRIFTVSNTLEDINREINGDALRRRYEGATPASLNERIGIIVWSLWSTTAAPTQTYKDSYALVASKFDGVLNKIKAAEKEVMEIEKALEGSGTNYTPGRLPDWRNE